MSASNHKVGSPINVWQSLANKFINQSSQLKVYWDKVGEIVREKHDALCDYIDSQIATKQELQNVTIGLIPDGTVTQDKLAPSLKDSLPAQYVRNRIPTSADNYAAGHKIGDAWYIPDITLNNLVPTPLAINTADFTIQNANASASGSAVTLSCLGGFDFASFKRTITPVAGALYVLFAELKLTSTHVLTSLSLNDQVIANPVKDTVYRVAQIVTAPTQIEIKAQALDGTALNGATVVIDKLTIVNMTADMDGVPFDKAGAEAYFQANPSFATHKLNNAKTRWYCSDNGVWQSSSQLGDETSVLFGADTVDKALLEVYRNTNIGKYFLFTSNGIFKVPKDVTQVYITGCASGGKGSDLPTYPAVAGKAGEYIVRRPFAVTPESLLEITVGSGNTVVTNVSPSLTLLANYITSSLAFDSMGVGFTTGIASSSAGGAFGFGGGSGGNVNSGLYAGGGGAAGGYGAGGGPAGMNQGGYAVGAGTAGAGLTAPRELGGTGGAIGAVGGSGSIVDKFKNPFYAFLSEIGLVFDTGGGGGGGSSSATTANKGGANGKGVPGGDTGKGGPGSPGFVLIEIV